MMKNQSPKVMKNNNQKRNFSNKSPGNFENKKNRNNNNNNYEENKFSKKRNYEFANSNDKSKENSKNSLYKKRNNQQYSHKENGLDDLIWGKHPVLSVLESQSAVNRIWCTPEIRSSEKFFLLLKEFKSRGVLIEEVSWSRISQITYGGVHQGIVLQKSYSQTTSLNNLIENAKTKSSHATLICLDGITDPHNVGAIVRSAEAFGCHGIILPQRRSSGLTGTVAKVAAGALENIEVSRVVNLNRALSELKDNGFIIVGLSADASESITEFNLKVPLVIVIGSENKGLSLLTQKNCDYLLRIPLFGKTSSLNASVAAAISIFQLSKKYQSINKI